MRILVVPLAALALTACFGAPSEPLTGENRVPPPVADDREELSAEEQVRMAMIEEIALAMGEAANVSFDAADAGLVRDQAAATEAAAQAAEVAAMVQQRAGEVVAVLEENANNGCGTSTPSTSSGSGVTDEDINDAVAAALCAANAAQEVSASLVPGEPTTECVCGVCTEVPGEIDEEALASAIENVTAAGEACGDSEDVLTDGNNTSI
ncbi:MAG: hypothetical protein A2138_26515 [Deltaproteobacteria bacterium RBG_16_71_12]|nr:MAG: hypothetical protein A2138_26515 [Deltaproteobacteria bacterium RBG_16_71_12]